MPQELPPLKTLKAFEAAARLASFSKAAQQLSLTPSAISRQIFNLEQALGVQLFDRSGSALSLTTQGKSYLETVGPVLQQLTKATKKVRRSESTLCLGVTHSFFNYYLAHKIKDFISEHEDIEIDFNSYSSSESFEQDEVEVNIRIGKSPYKNVINQPLIHQYVHPVAAPSLLEGCAQPYSFELLAKLPWLHYGFLRRQVWSDYVREAGFPQLNTSRHLSFDDGQMALEAAKAGLGVALAALPLINQEIESGQLVCLWDGKVGNRFTFYLSYPDKLDQHPTLIAFKSWISSSLQADFA